jgi:hypothetical protein
VTAGHPLQGKHSESYPLQKIIFVLFLINFCLFVCLFVLFAVFHCGGVRGYVISKEVIVDVVSMIVQ